MVNLLVLIEAIIDIGLSACRHPEDVPIVGLSVVEAMRLEG